MIKPVSETVNGITIIDRGTIYQPYAVVYGYDRETETWEHSFNSAYFDSYIEALAFMVAKAAPTEILTQALNICDRYDKSYCTGDELLEIMNEIKEEEEGK